ncbi:MFS transporter [Sporolactobacillus pectinivorans]|uniref:MFS transporter n=1 Tax=Sporolactobacillus pectinivorans TaxID=1591408 RepID=UPI001961A7EB|nr:MFS transporter [Sporolactobacillus pectinivorans]
MLSEKVKNILGLTALSMIMFIVTLDTTITNIALPTITSYFHANLIDSNWVSTIYVLVLSVSMIPASKLADQLGRKRIMLIGLLLFGLGSVLCGLAHSLLFLIIMRMIQGLGGAIATPVMIPLSVDLFGREKANQAVGVIGAVAAVAAAAGPPIGGLIIRFTTWHAIFFVNVPIVIVTLVLTSICFTESYDDTLSKKIDGLGMILLTMGLFQLTFVLLKGYDYGWTSRPILFMIAGTFFSLALFTFVEQRMEEPLLELTLFRERTFTASVIVYFICGFSIICSSVIFNFFLENIRHLTTLHAAYIIMFTSLMVMIAMPLGSMLAQRYDYRPVIFAGVLFMSISLFMLAQLKFNTTIAVMILDMIVLGFGFGLSSLAIVSSVQFVPQVKAGIASGMVNAARQLGTCMGIALLVGMMSHNIDTAKAQIENQAITTISHSQIQPSVKKMIVRDVKKGVLNNNDHIALSNGSDKILRLFNLNDQQIRVEKLMKELHTSKNAKSVTAFTKTFGAAGFIILLSSIFGLFTDRKKEFVDVDEHEKRPTKKEPI